MICVFPSLECVQFKAGAVLTLARYPYVDAGFGKRTVQSCSGVRPGKASAITTNDEFSNSGRNCKREPDRV